VIFKEDFFAQAAHWAMKLHIMQYLLNHIVKSYENCWALKLFLGHMLCENFKEKEILFVVSCLKSLYCQKMQFSALRVKCLLSEDFQITNFWRLIMYLLVSLLNNISHCAIKPLYFSFCQISIKILYENIFIESQGKLHDQPIDFVFYYSLLTPMAIFLLEPTQNCHFCCIH